MTVTLIINNKGDEWVSTKINIDEAISSNLKVG